MLKGGVAMTVRNIRGTSSSNRSVAWLSMWKTFAGHSPSKRIPCAIRGCTATAEVGAHVVKDYTGMRQYIVPMCREHNLQYGVDLPICKDVKPMPVV